MSQQQYYNIIIGASPGGGRLLEPLKLFPKKYWYSNGAVFFLTKSQVEYLATLFQNIICKKMNVDQR